jgi:RNA-directed DNA polymerase
MLRYTCSTPATILSSVNSPLRAKARPMAARSFEQSTARVPKTGKWLRSDVRGYFNYHAVPGDGKRLQAFRDGVTRYWRHTLRRRSPEGRIDWERMDQLVRRWIPLVRILHPYPSVRLDAIHPR